MGDMIRLTIDGREVEVPRGTTVLQAAEKLRLDVPRYCYHPGLSIAGNCRICLVEIEKMPKLMTSCSTQAADGMIVRTTGPNVDDGRRAVMEFLLANHPLDCPICDQAGECWLQEYSFRHGAAGSRFQEERIRGLKHESIGPHVMLDTERCIVCTRCVRFCDEVTETGELGVFQRGVFSYINTFPRRQLDNAYSGNTVDICPVGALTLKEFRFKKRVWWLKPVASVCGSCARGCNVDLGTADDKIYRLTPRENQAVNKWWMCDEGRLSFQALYDTPRLTVAQARRDGRVEALDWPEALDLLAERLKQARPGAVVAIASASMTVEDLYLLKRLFSECVRQGRIVIPRHDRGQDDDLLIRADKTPNAAGARLLGLEVEPPEGGGIAGVLADAKTGKLDVLLVLAEPVEELAAARERTFVCSFSAFVDRTVRESDLALPAVAYGEFDGTWVNFQKRAQKVRRALAPPGVALEGWRMISEVMNRMGAAARYDSAADVLSEIAGRVEAFRGVTPRSIGSQGVGL
ncbi:MAG: 2Fe-2S iron-sulfur cluster-binding protein [Acidobacteriota bacterium]